MPSTRVIPLFFRTKLMISFVSVLIALNLIGQRVFEWHPEYVNSELASSVLTIFMAGAASIIYQTFLSLFSTIEVIARFTRNESATWLNKQTQFIFSKRIAYAIMLILAVGGMITTDLAYVPWTGSVRVFYFSFTAVEFGIMGILGWSFLGLIIFLYRLSTLEIKFKPFSWLDKEFKHLHNSFLIIFGIGAVIYVNAVIAIWLTPGSVLFFQQNTIVQLWVFPLAGIVIAYFLAIEFLIHRMMARHKENALIHLNKLITKAYNEWEADKSLDRSKLVTELMGWKESIQKEREYPLNFLPILTIISGLLLPTVKTIIDILSQ